MVKTSESVFGQEPVTCLLHIGKTGGTFLQQIVTLNKERCTRPVALMSHADTAASTDTAFGVNRNLAFVFRNPVDRFASGFVSRLASGQPLFDSPWSTAEAIAFQYFEEPNHLAESLSSSNPRLKSAAAFGMDNITHLKRNYTHTFGAFEGFSEYRNKIVSCCELQNLDANLAVFLGRIGLDSFDMPERSRRHRRKHKFEPLSVLARKNLQDFWSEEFNYYRAFKNIEENLNSK